MNAAMNDDLISLNEQLRAEAGDILDRKGLRKILNQYGVVHVTGSYSLGLMTWRDLDIYLENENLTEQEFFELGKDVVSLLRPIKMSFRNERIAKTKGLPVGLYWGIYLGDEKKGSWKIDIWGLTSNECEQRLEFCNQIAERITPESKMKILEIKSRCWMDPLYRKYYTSNDVYTAVLEKHVHDVESFKLYLQDKLSV
jgi:hypothetical protein